MIKQSRELKVGDRFFCPPARQCFTILRIGYYPPFINVYVKERNALFAFEGHESIGVVSQSSMNQ